MNDAAPSAGIDVGSTWLDLGFHPFAKPIRARNSEARIATIVAALRERGAAKVALEANRFGRCRRIVMAGQGWARFGRYARKLVGALIEADVKAFMVNPRRIKAFRDAEGLIAKT